MVVLLPNCGFLSETSRMLRIAAALGARGVRTLVASHGGPYERLLDEAGVAWRRVEPAFDEAAARRFLEGVTSIARGDTPMMSDEFIRAAVQAEVELFREVGATMAVIGFNPTSFISTKVAGIPLAASHGGSFVPPVLERGLCPIPVNPPRPEAAKLPRFVQRLLANHAPRWLKAPVRGLNRIAAELGVEGLPSFMALMCGDLTLVTDVPEVLGLPRAELEAWRPRSRAYRKGTTLRYTGPLFATLDRPVPERVERFLSADGPVVYVSPTSVDAPFLRGLVGAVRAAGARVLVGATLHDVKELEDERTLVEGVLPNHLVMPRVAAAVVMGGQGSVQTAMTAGTPFVGLPYHGEQELNVALAERLGAALRLSPAAAATPALTQAVQRLLCEPAFKAAAARVKQHYAGVDGAAGAAQAISDFLGGRAVAAAGPRAA